MKYNTPTTFGYYNYHSAAYHNKQFNSEIDTILEDYFSPDNLKSLEEYCPIGEYKIELAKEYTIESENKKDIYDSVEKIDTSNFTFFSNYEKMLFTHFFYGNMTTYILSGAMGSGKTTTINYLFHKVLELDTYKETFLIILDFAKGYGNAGSTYDEILTNFNNDFYKKIKAELIEKITDYNLSESFLLKIKQKRQFFSDYYNLQFEIVEKSFDKWNKLPEKEKIYSIFTFIEKETDRGSISRLNMVMYFINYINEELSRRNIKVIFVYDNIDKLPPAAQRSIFINILALNAIATVKKIFTMRRSTKAKMDKILSRDENPLFENRSQYIYGHIYHHGPSVTKLYLTKLNQLIENIDNITLFNHISQDYKSKIISRANEVITKLENKSNFRQAFCGISGQSKRLALTIAKRPFCNNVINYDETSNNLQSLVRTLYTGSDENMRISIQDNYVCNIFSDRNNTFTLANYLILFILDKYISDDKLYYLKNVKQLYTFLTSYFEYSSDEILFSLNYLLSDKRALIGGEYYPKYEDLDDLIRIKDNLRITELGDRYYKSLLLNGSIYNQVCLLSLKWKDIYSNIYKSDSIADRFQDLRHCIKEVIIEEDNRFLNLKRNCKIHKLKIQIDPISKNILKLLSRTLLGILPSLELRESLKEELIEWLDLLILMDNKYGGLKHELNSIEKFLKIKGINKRIH
ncbi:MAG: hypothetical protein IPL92_17995 [Saprospiraceae bacterium]|nr:hypothetical protein [Candidatus Opimibacter iunctus]